uniref:Uncharacterized protein n=1 Tax=Rhizophora mucronata TaxID=61149 RepID=A0A2P2J1R2_RHIMU
MIAVGIMEIFPSQVGVISLSVSTSLAELVSL